MRNPVRKKPVTKEVRQQVTLTLPPDLLARLDAVAEKEERSRAKLVEIVMRQWLEEHREAGRKANTTR
jgi:metal-responsive CopG/Arc/MetJ family transcriptional regulator